VQDVEAAEPTGCRGDRVGHRRLCADVGHDGHRLAAGGLDLGGDLFGSRAVEVDHGHRCSLGSQAVGGGPADAGRAAGDHGHAAAQATGDRLAICDHCGHRSPRFSW
jgi:hypothetical protein